MFLKIMVPLFFMLMIFPAHCVAEVVPVDSDRETAKNVFVKKTEWHSKLSLNYNASSGNTETSLFKADIAVSARKEFVREITFKGEGLYSTSNKEADGNKYFASARYAWSFGPGERKQWYGFYKIEVDRDRFANIDLRSVPSAGVGFWFLDLQDIKLMAEVAGGFSRSDYIDGIDPKEETIFIPRAYFEKKLFSEARVFQEFAVYPNVADISSFRMHSVTKLTSPISQSIAIGVSIVDDYNSSPVLNAKKNDVSLMSSLVFSF